MSRNTFDKTFKNERVEIRLLSVIIPSYNEEEMVEKSGNVISEILLREGIEFELIFVDDGSKDNTWKMIQDIACKNTKVRGIHFSRNFGKESAIIAGLSESIGACCVVIDCDLQHPPEKIIEMYHLWEQGFEVVEGRKSSRGSETVAHSFAVKVFYGVISKATGFDMENSSDFKLLDRKAVDVLINMHERNAFFRAMSSWIGFETIAVDFEVQERKAGESKWPTWVLIKYALSNISSFSTAPMQVVTVLGVIMFIVSMVFGFILYVQTIMGSAQGGFATVILVSLFSSSVIMISLGIIGYYIACIYEEIKGRPKYIISRTCGDKGY